VKVIKVTKLDKSEVSEDPSSGAYLKRVWRLPVVRMFAVA
jgi:hypothetical protein